MFSEVPYLPGTEPELVLGGSLLQDAAGARAANAGAMISACYRLVIARRFFLLYDRWSRPYKTSTNIEVKRVMDTISATPLGRLLTVGEVAERSGLAVSALHFYEAKGLISSIRTRGNQRRYGRDVLRRLGIIKVAQRVGIPLLEIQTAFASLPQGRTPTVADWQTLSARWKNELDERIRRLSLLRDRLTGCIGCGCLSIESCPLRNPCDRLGEEGPGARLLENENES